MKVNEKMLRTYNGKLLVIGAFVMLLGMFYYSACRGIVYQFESLSCPQGNVFTSLPSFIHVFALSILSFSLGVFNTPIKCAGFWVTINFFFELGQIMEVASEILPDFFNDYFVNGTYSSWDIISCLVGATTALIIMETTKTRRDGNDSHQ